MGVEHESGENMTNKKCPSCGVEMVAGRRRDVNDPVVVSCVCQEAWLPGIPEEEILGLGSGWGKALPVITHACPDCGLLQSYVNPVQLAKKLDQS